MTDAAESRQTIKPAPIRKRLEVNAPIWRTFDVFVASMGGWWPRDHSLLKDTERKAIVIEPKSGGRWYEEGVDGTVNEWGTVREWSPPDRVLLVWQLNNQFAYDPDFETAVEVRFTADGEGRTIVEFEHRDLERFGETAVTQAELMDAGWSLILAAFVASAEA
jgi:uncharacterized protein YndB with AHSA1/START domain